MNRQQRRQAERGTKKDQKNFRNTLTNSKEREINSGAIRETWKESQIHNNYEWTVRLERLKNIKGIGPKKLDAIFKALEKPLTQGEREKARKQYESGVGGLDGRNQESTKEN